ncbi:GDSL-type esterase/lipase family protein [Microbacterium sp. NPDC077184]|uniref:SGNH/GDSL hydrolase family protein n=1 Tax=Microbacterium sp. NPDC077184 TaxID=3154764 RepID=UPI003416F13E
MTRAHASARIALLVAAALSVSGCAPGSADPVPTVPTGSAGGAAAGPIAVIGDSMALGVNSCSDMGECPAASWALGDDPTVASVSARLAGQEGASRPHVWAAKNGGTVADAIRLADTAVAERAGIVLILIGANNVCRPDTAAVTPVADFGAQYTTLIDTVRTGLPDAQIVALSIPDLLRMWELGRDDPEATARWNASSSCRSLLADPASDAAVDVQRRAGIDETVRGYNAAIAEACEADARCVHDAGAIHALDFTSTDISSIDHFHASASGQAKVAQVAWETLAQTLDG